MDIILDIISRLPVKSVLTVKSVSKACYSIIKNPSFIKKHHEYANLNLNPTFSAVLSTCWGGNKSLRVNPMEALKKPIDLDLPFLSSCTGIMVLSICIGLVCLMLNFSRLPCVCICNPLTGDFILVPGIGDGCTYFEFSDEDEHMYLGFCLNGDKGYELFKILYEYFPDDDDDEHTMYLEGAVYSLTTNTWREFDVNWGDFEYLEDHSKSCYSNQAMPVFERGVFYWEATDFETAYIVSFDVKKDVFDDYLAPSDCSDEEWMLCDLKGEAAVVVHHDDSESFDIWVLDETKKSWVLKLQVEDLPDVTILGCVESGVLAVQGSKGKNGKILTLFV